MPKKIDLGIDRDVLCRSLKNSLSESVRVPSYERLEFFVRRFPKAQIALRGLYQKSLEFVIYDHQIKRAVDSKHGIGCNCDWCAINRRYREFRRIIWNWLNALRREFGRKNFLRGLFVDVIARKLVFTGGMVVA
jgi:hypothetical protein